MESGSSTTVVQPPGSDVNIKLATLQATVESPTRDGRSRASGSASIVEPRCTQCGPYSDCEGRSVKSTKVLNPRYPREGECDETIPPERSCTVNAPKRVKFVIDKRGTGLESLTDAKKFGFCDFCYHRVGREFEQFGRECTSLGIYAEVETTMEWILGMMVDLELPPKRIIPLAHHEEKDPGYFMIQASRRADGWHRTFFSMDTGRLMRLHPGILFASAKEKSKVPTAMLHGLGNLYRTIRTSKMLLDFEKSDRGCSLNLSRQEYEGVVTLTSTGWVPLKQLKDRSKKICIPARQKPSHVGLGRGANALRSHMDILRYGRADALLVEQVKDVEGKWWHRWRTPGVAVTSEVTISGGPRRSSVSVGNHRRPVMNFQEICSGWHEGEASKCLEIYCVSLKAGH